VNIKLFNPDIVNLWISSSSYLHPVISPFHLPETWGQWCQHCTKKLPLTGAAFDHSLAASYVRVSVSGSLQIWQLNNWFDSIFHRLYYAWHCCWKLFLESPSGSLMILLLLLLLRLFRETFSFRNMKCHILSNQMSTVEFNSWNMLPFVRPET